MRLKPAQATQVTNDSPMRHQIVTFVTIMTAESFAPPCRLENLYHTMNTRLKLVTLLAATAAIVAPRAHALDGKVVLDQLVKKGVLTAEEADAIVKKDAARAQTKAAESGPKWYDKLKIDGYVQMRFTEQLDDEADLLDVPADKSTKPTESIILRRGRIKLTGDVAERLHFYSQIDLQATVGTGMGVQARDLYFDLDFDDAGEHRLRAGLSKVPYGWVNMQSSQNRLAMERPEALNSGVEGERDYGLYYMWAGKHHRELFKKFVKDGLKGSGDYGVFTVGAFNGQGLNKSDLNGEPHLLARVSVPWETASGQCYEAGFGGYAGKYVVTKSAISRVGLPGTAIPGGGDFMSSTTGEFRDDRVSAHFIMYPQPFGLEAEWTYGQGPQLNDTRTRITNDSLHGGYLMANYRIQAAGYEYIPFVRWNYFEGARKFGTNASQMHVNEYDLGTEVQIGKGWEITLVYTYTDKRTNTATAPYADVRYAQRLAAQLQFNF